ncbi:DUF7266 family protein [Halorubrum halodurans]|uniref:Uncharacterized protein n=1 Tax=Halorubrum halodurans TaxID=1383851 RepID=A0A256IN66_9EURY|nr:hypothetical protein [Halorubrum halodurans]OYR57974.1 hypothetical protein DJ70_04650 [Halorubrum halodurans]
MSTTVGYVLTLAIGAALLSGVVIGVGGVLDAQTDRAVHGELAVAGQSLASTLESADRTARLAEAGRADPDLDPADGTAVAVIEADLPTRVAGIPYTVEIAGDPDPAVILRTTHPDASVRIPYRSRTAVAETTLRGGPVRVTYVADAADPSAGTLAVTER